MITRLSSRLAAARRNQGGFTLIELLVVIIILGIISAVVVFAVQGAGDKGASAAMATDAETLRTAEEAFYARPGQAPGAQSYGTEQQLVEAGLLSEESTYHDIVLLGSGPSSTFRVVCNATQTGCGSGGATPKGGTLRVAGGTTVTAGNFVNPASTTSGGAHGNTEYMFNGLLRWAENNTAQPDLAQSFVISPDQQTATFTLRAAQFHDGTPLEAHDVDFTFRNALVRWHGRTQGSMVPAFGGTLATAGGSTIPAGAITFPDPDGAGPLTGGPNGRGVQFNFVTPYAPLLRQLNVTEAPIIPQHIYSACPATGANNLSTATCALNNPGGGDLIATNATRHIGTGPFMLKVRDTANHVLTLVRNPNYHWTGLPLVDEIVQVPKTPSEAADALQAKISLGGVHVGTVQGDRLPPATGPTILSEPDFLLAPVPRGSGGGNCVLTWGFNLWQKGKTPTAIQADIAANPTKRGDHPFFGDPTIIDVDGAGPVPPMPRGLVVRKALTMGLNRTALFNNVEFGKGRVPDSAYHSKLAGAYSAQTMLPFDPVTADAWLDAAGWSDATTPRQSTGAVGMAAAGAPVGTAFTFQSHGFADGTQATYFTQIANQLNTLKVGVTTIATAAGPGPVFGTRPWDAMFFSMCQGDDPVIGARRSIHSSQISDTPFTNMSGYYNPTVDQLWNTAFGANYTPNHGQIQAIVVEEAPMVWISETLNTRVWRNNCGGFNNQNTGLYLEAASCGA